MKLRNQWLVGYFSNVKVTLTKNSDNSWRECTYWPI